MIICDRHLSHTGEAQPSDAPPMLAVSFCVTSGRKPRGGTRGSAGKCYPMFSYQFDTSARAGRRWIRRGSGHEMGLTGLRSSGSGLPYLALASLVKYHEGVLVLDRGWHLGPSWAFGFSRQKDSSLSPVGSSGEQRGPSRLRRTCGTLSKSGHVRG